MSRAPSLEGFHQGFRPIPRASDESLPKQSADMIFQTCCRRGKQGKVRAVEVGICAILRLRPQLGLEDPAQFSGLELRLHVVEPQGAAFQVDARFHLVQLQRLNDEVFDGNLARRLQILERTLS